jgi:hypothetical protein
MADQFRDQINTARRAGYSDDELIGYLKDKDPRISTALESGYQPTEILQFIAPKLSMGEEAVRKTGVAIRGLNEALAPAAAGATAGFMMGGPVGAGVGALAGGLAVPATDVLVQGYNKLTGNNVRLPSQVISEMLPGPRAETPVERVVQGSAGALGGTGSSVSAGRSIANIGKTGQGLPSSVAPGTLAIGQEAARLPVSQMITAPVATAAGQTVTELTDNQLAGLLTGVATGTVAGTRPTKRGAVPTAAELASKSKANYDVLEKSGFELDNAQFNAHMGGMAAKLRASAGYDPRIMPNVEVALSNLTSGNAKNVGELDTLRTIIGNAAKSGSAPERNAAKQLLDEFDTYVTSAPPSAVVAGDTSAMKAWKDARADYAKMKKSELITDIIENAEIAKGTKEGSIASQLIALAKNDKKMRFFTAEEQDAIREAAKGGKIQSLLNVVGKFSPSTPAAAIFTAVNPLGVYTAAAGMASKSLADQRRIQQANALANRMRLGETPEVLEGPLANQPVFFSRGVQNMLGPVQQNQNALAPYRVELRGMAQ